MEKGLSTKLIHAGESEFAKKVAASVSQPKVMPIYMSSVFSFDDVPTLDAVYDGTQEGYVYSRMSNPGIDSLTDVICQAEGCDGAIVFSSGMAAIINSFITNVEKGDHIISSPVLYGGVYDYLKNEIVRFGIEVDFVDFLTENIEDYIKPNTKIIYTETITNPLMEVMDIKKIADIAHKHGAKLIVDNTFATPAICRPLDLGADIVVYSGTKYLGGHSDIISGVLCTNRENYLKSKKTSILYGATLSPFDGWLLTRSLRTLDLRMEKHSANALKLAAYLENHPKVSKVYYPGLASSSFNQLANKQFTNGWCGGMLSADIVGDEKGASAFIAACETIKFIPSLAGVATSISYPAKTSHRAYSKEEMERCGISMGQLRFSTGLEKIEDVLEEFDKAFKSV